MKKILIGIAALVTVSNVSAEICTAELKQKDRNRSYTIQSFSKYDFNQQRACDVALQECNQEMRQRARFDRHANLTCTVETIRNGNGNGYGNGSRNCSYDLQRQNGRVVESYSRISCKAAQDACMRDLIQRNGNGNSLRARCVESGPQSNPRRRN